MINKKPIHAASAERKERIYIKGACPFGWAPDFLGGHPDIHTESVSSMIAGVLLIYALSIIVKYGKNVTMDLRNFEKY